MVSKSELTNSKAVSSEWIDDWLERIWIAAQRFKDKVERDAPACFVPSKELKELFDVLDEEIEA